MLEGREQSFRKDAREEDIGFILSHESGSRLKIEDFSDVFGPEEIANDKKLVSAISARFESNLDHLDSGERQRVEKGKKRADALEILVADQIELNNWLGPEANLVRTSDYDDLVNGVDAVAEFAREGEDTERIALAVDVSMRTDLSSVSRKIDRNIKKVVGEGDTARVKYFSSEADGFRGSLESVVPVVIGLDGDDCDRLMSLFGQILKLRANKERTDLVKEVTKEKMAELEKHPAQMVFLNEIKVQLEMYLSLLEKAVLNESHRGYGPKIKKTLELIEEIMESKKEIVAGDLNEDGVWEMIREIAREKTRQP